MKNTLRRLVLAALAAPLAFAQVSSPAPRRAVVLTAVENMYRRSSDLSDVVSQTVLGTAVQVLQEEKNERGESWSEIETPDTYRGWVAAGSLRLLRDDEKAYASAGRVIEVTSLFANIYAVADVTKRKPLVTVPIGVRLETGECGERWCGLTLPDGRPGWVQVGDGALVDALSPRPRLSTDEMVSLAKRFLGLPYYWGGTTPFGLDCSGYVQLSYGLAGIPILRDADIQFEGSGLQPVPAGEEKAGDLVFFGRAANRISHVGMMVDGQDFINATTHERPVVQISRLKDPYWQKIYQGARRPPAPAK
jgi:gamma-D-glutamyl-L-lysine dipeptidyl-peptidase